MGVGLVLWLSCDVQREARMEAPPGPEKPLDVETDPVEAEETGAVPCAGYPEAGPGGPFRLTSSGSILPPRRIEFERVDIASLGLQMSEVGVLFAEVVISETGRVDSVKVVRSAHPDFDQASIEALSRSRFEPATRNGRPVSVCMVFTVQPHP